MQLIVQMPDQSMALEAKYNAKRIENKWYGYWMESRYFHSEVDERTPYTIVIPPPNVTGVCIWAICSILLAGCLIRRARLQGFNAC